ncbi:ComEA family DNA-binding protein [Nocardia crassostreae]|uniref:ComEA family DNA-binding protein n=1 Tax=Nocardia crassostreae TaxID=53428 RepID=UPI0008316AEF|nr:helix-hairpin-helix domain-containing protein [Nocardia crassostreae]
MNGALPGTHGWRTANSLWIIPTFLCGFLTWASFLYIGVRTKHRPWLISAAVYFAATIGIFVLLGLSGPTDDDVASGKAAPPTPTQQTIDDWGAGALIAVWIGGIVHALLAHPHYLHRIQSGVPRQHPPMPLYPNPIREPQAPTWLTDDTQHYWAAPAAPGFVAGNAQGRWAPPGAPAAGAAWPTSGQPQQWASHPPTATPVAAWPDPRALVAAPDSAAPDSNSRVLVNTASAEQFSALALGPDTVAAVLAARDRSGGIRDLQEFASVSGLKPHELRRIADRLDFTGATPQPARALGRKLDL